MQHTQTPAVIRADCNGVYSYGPGARYECENNVVAGVCCVLKQGTVDPNFWYCDNCQSSGDGQPPTSQYTLTPTPPPSLTTTQAPTTFPASPTTQAPTTFCSRWQGSDACNRDEYCEWTIGPFSGPSRCFPKCNAFQNRSSCVAQPSLGMYPCCWSSQDYCVRYVWSSHEAGCPPNIRPTSNG